MPCRIRTPIALEARTAAGGVVASSKDGVLEFPTGIGAEYQIHPA
jgi:hypothetical protein